MKLNLPICHIVVGVIGLVTFLLTGQYMDLVHEHLVNMDDGPRMIYRSTHIYILLVSILNVCIGVTMTTPAKTILQYLVSVVILIAPFLMTIEFFYGTRDVTKGRFFAYYALVSLFAVTCALLLNHFYVTWWKKKE